MVGKKKTTKATVRGFHASPAKKDRYVEEDPNHCPSCGAKLKGLGTLVPKKRQVDREGHLVICMEMQCPKCKRSWHDQYLLVGVHGKQTKGHK